MIVVTRLNGARFAINDEQIERLEEAPNTVMVLVNGNRYLVLESLDEIIERIVAFRAGVLDSGQAVEIDGHPRGRRQAGLALFRAPAQDLDDDGVTDVAELPRPLPDPHLPHPTEH